MKEGVSNHHISLSLVDIQLEELESWGNPIGWWMIEGTKCCPWPSTVPSTLYGMVESIYGHFGLSSRKTETRHTLQNWALATQVGHSKRLSFMMLILH